MPSQLPELALHECPRSFLVHDQAVQQQQLKQPSAVPASKLGGDYLSSGVDNVSSKPRLGSGRHHGGSDENDPTALNRVGGGAGFHSHQQKGGPPSLTTTATTNATDSLSAGTSVRPATTLHTIGQQHHHQHQQQQGSNIRSTRSHTTGATVSSQEIATSEVPLPASGRAASSSSSSSSSSSGRHHGSACTGTRSSSATRGVRTGTGTGAGYGSGSYSQKFDIFVDSKTQQQRPLSARSSSTGAQDAAAEVERMQRGLENVHLTTDTQQQLQLPSANAPGSGSGSGPTSHSSRRSTSSARTRGGGSRNNSSNSSNGRSGDNNYNKVSPAVPAEAWSWNREADRFPASKAVQPPSAHDEAVAPTAKSEYLMSTPAAQGAAGSSSAARAEVEAEVESQPMCVTTPQDQVISSKDSKPLGTLETMHDMLNNSFSVVDSNSHNPQAAAAAMALQQEQQRQQQAEQQRLIKSPTGELASKVWVVRYVDYTSKYGLGFLFNTGSAGVYFNDSTKIVLSSDGLVFQYTERRRRDSSLGSEHSSQKHLISSYPPELQKKVTLLKHFRNYLVDQQKSHDARHAGDGDGDGATASASAAPEGAAGGVGAMLSGQGLVRDGKLAEGACAAVKFGQSSTRYSAAGAVGGTEDMAVSPGHGSGTSGDELGTALGLDVDEGEDVEMPFLKKWVRTKHAILFRISNRTVQVVFYDRR